MLFMKQVLEFDVISRKDLAKTILLLRSVQSKNNSKTCQVVKKYLKEIRAVYKDMFDSGNITSFRKMLADNLGNRLFSDFYLSQDYQKAINEMEDAERTMWIKMAKDLILD